MQTTDQGFHKNKDKNSRVEKFEYKFAIEIHNIPMKYKNSIAK